MVAESNSLAGSDLFFVDCVPRSLLRFEQNSDWRTLPNDRSAPGAKEAAMRTRMRFMSVTLKRSVKDVSPRAVASWRGLKKFFRSSYVLVPIAVIPNIP